MTALLRPEDWTHDAACAGHPLGPEAWDRGTPAARAVCADCPVRFTCASRALNRAEPDAMWGGLTTDDRRRIARERGYDRPGAARHGDYSRYVTCKADNGRPCAPCREAKRRWAADRRAQGAWTRTTDKTRASA